MPVHRSLWPAPFLLLLATACSPEPAAPPPAAVADPCADCSVLWITVDTLRQDRVGAYGNPDPSPRAWTPWRPAGCASGTPSPRCRSRS